MILWAIVFNFISVIFNGPSFAVGQDQLEPKIFVDVKPTEDRWITFIDGSKIFHGLEVSYILAHALHRSGKYMVQVSESEAMTFSSSSSRSDSFIDRSDFNSLRNRLPEDLSRERSEILGRADKNLIFQSTVNGVTGFGNSPQIVIRPRVQTLLYSSGARSHRMVYGFSPETINPFNAGRAGSYDNEFTISNLAVHRVSGTHKTTGQFNSKNCGFIDFFEGQMKVMGYGPWKGNFGANSDEGVSFSILGFGGGFKRRVIQVKSEIVFDVEFPGLGFQTTLSYKMLAGGQDLFFAGQFNGISAAVEIQRRKTLREALKQILPQITQEVAEMLSAVTAQTFVASPRNVGRWDPSTMRLPFIASEGRLELNFDQNVPHVEGLVEKASSTSGSSCLVPTRYGLLEGTIVSLFTGYGIYRYFNVLDQSFEKLSEPTQGPRVAIVSSGISPKEKKLNGFVSKTGFDFLSWDSRPSDDLGIGTASALYLKDQYGGALRFVPIRVIGPYGEIHSGELYAALKSLSERRDIDLVVIPFSPEISSKAFELGIEAIVQSGKNVVISARYPVAGATLAQLHSNAKTTRVLGARARLSKEAVGVLNKAVELIRAQR